MEENKELKDAIRNSNAHTFPDLTEVHEQLRATAKANVHHTPRQEGPYLVCTSCHYKHTIAYIGSNKSMVGIASNGEPILRDR